MYQIVYEDLTIERISIHDEDDFKPSKPYLFFKKLSKDEINKIPKEINGIWQMVNKEPKIYTNEEKLLKVRNSRDSKFMQTITVIKQRHEGEREGLEKGLTTKPMTLTEEEYNIWLLYWEQLRDITDVDLTNVDYNNIESVFPEMPDMKIKK